MPLDLGHVLVSDQQVDATHIILIPHKLNNKNKFSIDSTVEIKRIKNKIYAKILTKYFLS